MAKSTNYTPAQKRAYYKKKASETSDPKLKARYLGKAKAQPKAAKAARSVKSAGKSMAASSSARRSLSKQIDNKVSREVKKDAMGGFMDRPGSIVADSFRLAEYSDDLTTNTRNGVNQIFEQIALSPGAIVGRAHKNQVERKEVPSTYKIESYLKNYYRYSFDKLEFEITNIVPETVAGTIAAMIVPDPQAVISVNNVLDVFDSIRSNNGKNSENAIIIPPGTTGRLSMPSTGLLFVKDNVQGDIRLNQAGQLVIFAMTEFLSAMNAGAANPAAPATNRAWGGEVALCKVRLSCRFVDKQLVPTSTEDSLQGQTPGVPTPFPTQAVALNADMCALGQQIMDFYGPGDVAYAGQFIGGPPTISIGAIQEAAVVASAEIAATNGEVETKTNAVDVVYAMTLGPKALFSLQDLNDFTAPSGTGTVKEISWEGVTRWFRSAVEGFLAIPGKINDGLVKIFGEKAGNALYNVGKQAVTIAATAILALTPAGLNDPNVPVRNSGQGWPFLPAVAGGGYFPCIGPVTSGSQAYSLVLQALRSTDPDLWDDINFFINQGINVTLISMPAGYLTSNTVTWQYGPGITGSVMANGPWIGAVGTLDCWDVVSGSKLTAKSGFGQPPDADYIPNLGIDVEHHLDPRWLVNLPTSQYNLRYQRVTEPATFMFTVTDNPSQAMQVLYTLSEMPAYDHTSAQFALTNKTAISLFDEFEERGYPIFSEFTQGRMIELEGHYHYFPSVTGSDYIFGSTGFSPQNVTVEDMVDTRIYPVNIKLFESKRYEIIWKTLIDSYTSEYCGNRVVPAQSWGMFVGWPRARSVQW